MLLTLIFFNKRICVNNNLLLDFWKYKNLYWTIRVYCLINVNNTHHNYYYYCCDYDGNHANIS